ncbi:stage V sporulation protein AC [Serpentinicella sp. ANB-PHB4]|uniref:stage V sporulation protein AC n=1 Tax=Serpentinicella sp. ANB-PHB4 TaxID=3074076 RepID=UPI0028547A1B|nr:stage V sporulation protein AC [Serpentinicella sp. ANB-PHB4]MDR5658940.1 stage V sporulation protein AC [Serpentinicella sp. ANB-PHB4]
MSNKKNKKLTTTQLKYQEFAKEREPKRSIVKNCIKAFLVGGTICTFGQFLQWMFMTYFDFDKVTASNPTVAVLIMIASLLTGLGVYDHIAQFAGGGTIIPVTGFANTMTAAAIEHKSEGYVLGVGGNMFKIAGPVITYGVFSAFIIALIKMTITWLGGM